MTRFIKVEVSDGEGRTHSFVVNGDQHRHTLMSLLGAVSVPHREWEMQEAQRKKAQEEARARARRQQEEEARTRNYWTRQDQDHFDDFFHENPQFFSGRYDGFRNFYNEGFQRPTGPGPQAGPRPTVKTRKERLADMAEIAWEVAQRMGSKVLLKKAQRKCHPDTGGSHQKWLDLQKLQQEMGI